MNAKRSLSVATALLIMFLVFNGADASVAPGTNAAVQTPVENAFTYQGYLRYETGLVTATCDFQFSLWDSVDGTSGQIGATISKPDVSVENGLFSVELDFGSGIFEGQAVWIEIAVQCPGDASFITLSPRQSVNATPYALYAKQAGTTNSTAYDHVIVVAKSGGQFTSVQTALDSISSDESERYLVWVAPGVYTETVQMKPFVDIAGAGEGVTKITSPGFSTDSEGTIRGATNAELRSLTIENTGGNIFSIAINNQGTAPHISNVTVTASNSDLVMAIFNHAGAEPQLRDLSVIATSTIPSTTIVLAIKNLDNVQATLIDINASAEGGDAAVGMASYNSCELTMHGVTATGKNANVVNFGILNDTGTTGTMKDVIGRGYGGDRTIGMYVEESSFSISDSVFSGSDGVENFGVFISVPNIPGSYELTIHNSSISGSTATIRNDPNFTTRVGNSFLEGGPVNLNGGVIVCAGVYDENFTIYPNSCP